MALYIFQVQCHRVCARFLFVHVTYSMRSQVNLSILLVRELEFALIQADIVLDKEKHLIREIRGP
jgi:hypothetical protein